MTALLNGRSPGAPGGGMYWRVSVDAIGSPLLLVCSIYYKTY
jgi:hypothetical protein